MRGDPNGHATGDDGTPSITPGSVLDTDLVEKTYAFTG